MYSATHFLSLAASRSPEAIQKEIASTCSGFNGFDGGTYQRFIGWWTKPMAQKKVIPKPYVLIEIEKSWDPLFWDIPNQ